MLLKILHMVHALHALQRVWSSRNVVGAKSNSCFSMHKSVPLLSSRRFLSCLKFTDESSIPEYEDPVLCFDLVGSPTLSNIDYCAYGVPLISSHIVNSHSCSNSNPPQRFCWFVKMWLRFMAQSILNVRSFVVWVWVKRGTVTWTCVSWLSPKIAQFHHSFVCFSFCPPDHAVVVDTVDVPTQEPLAWRRYQLIMARLVLVFPRVKLLLKP